MLQNRLGLAAAWLSGLALTLYLKWQIPVLRKISTGEPDGRGGKYEITKVANMKSQKWQI